MQRLKGNLLAAQMSPKKGVVIAIVAAGCQWLVGCFSGKGQAEQLRHHVHH